MCAGLERWELPAKRLKPECHNIVQLYLPFSRNLCPQLDLWASSINVWHSSETFGYGRKFHLYCSWADQSLLSGQFDFASQGCHRRIVVPQGGHDGIDWLQAYQQATHGCFPCIDGLEETGATLPAPD